MGRPGVTYREVVNAATELLAQGKNPTIEQIRLLLGSGSSSTLAVHLRQWKSEQGESDTALRKENIPQELIATIKGLWERVVATADDKVAAIEQASQAEIDEIRGLLSERDGELQGLSQKFGQLQQAHQTTTNDNLVLQSAVNTVQKENVGLKSQIEKILQQVEEKQAHNEELSRLHAQSQKNLEHYRESAREQRLVDQQRFEHQMQQQEVIIQQQRDTMQQINIDHAKVVDALQQVTTEKTGLQQTVDHLTARLDSLQQQLSQVIAERNENHQAMKHWQNQWQAAQQKVDEISVRLVEADKQTAVLNHQVTALEKEVIGLSDQTKLLAHDKWILVQEKSQLEGQLQQMEKIVA